MARRPQAPDPGPAPTSEGGASRAMDGIEFTSPGRAEAADSEYVTQGGVRVRRRCAPLDFDGAVEPLIEALDRRRGVLLSSGTEFPGRYTRGDIGFVDPPLALTARGRRVTV